MSLWQFCITSPAIKPGELLSALDTLISPELIAQAITESQSQQQRKRSLPTHVVVALIIAMSLWASDSVVDVFNNLMQGLSSQWIRLKVRLKTPTSSSISEARQRVGPRVMTRLFELVARPLATQTTEGAFLGGLRLMAIDGTVFDVPDTEANARVFGYPGSRPGTKAAFPKVRLVFLVELGTHLLTDAFLSPYRIGERIKARKLLRSVGEGMLVMWDRGLHSFKMVKAGLDQNSHILGRVPAQVKFEVVKVLADGSYLSWIAPDHKSKKLGATPIQVRVIEYVIKENSIERTYRLITDLMDFTQFPALLLAQSYHSRWEAENTLDELKVHLNGRKTPIRSKNPREVVQEIYGWLLAHYCVRYLIFRAASDVGIAPTRIGFTGTLKVIRRAIPQFQQATPAEKPLFLSWLFAEILDQTIAPRQLRINSRAVKKTRSKFPAVKSGHRGRGTYLQPLTLSVVLAA